MHAEIDSNDTNASSRQSQRFSYDEELLRSCAESYAAFVRKQALASGVTVDKEASVRRQPAIALQTSQRDAPIISLEILSDSCWTLFRQHATRYGRFVPTLQHRVNVNGESWRQAENAETKNLPNDNGGVRRLEPSFGAFGDGRQQEALEHSHYETIISGTDAERFLGFLEHVNLVHEHDSRCEAQDGSRPMYRMSLNRFSETRIARHSDSDPSQSNDAPHWARAWDSFGGHESHRIPFIFSLALDGRSSDGVKLTSLASAQDIYLASAAYDYDTREETRESNDGMRHHFRKTGSSNTSKKHHHHHHHHRHKHNHESEEDTEGHHKEKHGQTNYTSHTRHGHGRSESLQELARTKDLSLRSKKSDPDTDHDLEITLSSTQPFSIVHLPEEASGYELRLDMPSHQQPKHRNARNHNPGSGDSPHDVTNHEDRTSQDRDDNESDEGRRKRSPSSTIDPNSTGNSTIAGKFNSRTRVSPFSRSLNWATANNPDGVPLVHPAFDQGACGSCWAFAATGTVEASAARTSANLAYHHFLRTHRGHDAKSKAIQHAQAVERSSFEAANLSVQELVDCDDVADQGCRGGNPLLAFFFIHRYGLVSWDDYQYKSRRGDICHVKHLRKPIAAVQSWGILTSNREDLVEWVLRFIGPVAVGINGSDPSFVAYEKGIFDKVDCSTELNHAMLIVGYGEEEDPENGIIRYWIARNSWGVDWGENGFIRIKRNDDPNQQSPGICGILSSPSVALGGSLLRHSTADVKSINANIKEHIDLNHDPDPIEPMEANTALAMDFARDIVRPESLAIRSSSYVGDNQAIFLGAVTIVGTIVFVVLPLFGPALRRARGAVIVRASAGSCFTNDESATLLEPSDDISQLSGTMEYGTRLES